MCVYLGGCLFPLLVTSGSRLNPSLTVSCVNLSHSCGCGSTVMATALALNEWLLPADVLFQLPSSHSGASGFKWLTAACRCLVPAAQQSFWSCPLLPAFLCACCSLSGRDFLQRSSETFSALFWPKPSLATVSTRHPSSDTSHFWLYLRSPPVWCYFWLT